jgi:hypothetical protein
MGNTRRSDLSPDGKWLAYSIRRVSTDEELRVASLTGARKDIVAAFGRRPAFSDDSKFLAYVIGISESEQDKLKKAKKPVEDQLGILNLSTGETVVIREGVDGEKANLSGAREGTQAFEENTHHAVVRLYA